MRSVPKSGIPDAHRVVEASRAAWWRIDRYDLYWLIALTLIAGILRFASPIFLDVFAHPGSSAPIPLMYRLARQLLTVRFFAIAAGVLTAFDGMPFVEARPAVIDIIPITLVVLAYLLFHLHLTADTVFRRRLMIALTGVTLGLA